MLTDGKQIAAARQLLGWSQADLAERAGVSKPSVIRIEKDLMGVKDEIRKALVKSMNAENIEFIQGGARQINKVIDIYEGEDCYVRLMDDAYIELAETKGEILFSASDERRSPKIIIDKFNAMRAAGITMRSLIKDGDTHIMGPLAEYRWMNDALFVDGDVKAIFSDKTAYLMSWRGVPRVVIIKDQNIAEENKRIFEFIWSISKTPTHSTAEEKYKW